MGNSGWPPPGESQLRQSRATQSTMYAGCLSVSVIHRTLDMDHGIFNVRTDVNACDCPRWGTDTVRESAPRELTLGEKSPCRAKESNLRRRRAGPMLYQLSYIPKPASMKPRNARAEYITVLVVTDGSVKQRQTN